jgi:predicted TIM-barrel fold metal-dependent hydrolase
MYANIPIIALEEHYSDAELAATGAERSPAIAERLGDVGELRLREMDGAGIDVQVLSHASPSAQRLGKDVAADMTRRVNDRLAASISRHPTRFAGFAALPTIDAEAAAEELDRCVRQLGFKGAMIHGLTNGMFLDDKRFWPIFERAEALNVPLYLHPSAPHPAVVEAYYKDYVKDFPHVIRAAWGFTVETATQAIRLVLSGVFEKHPGLKIVIGHFGETLPFLLWRINQALSRPGNVEMNFRKVFCEHFYITTSGNFSTPALMCTIMEMSIDRILFSVDWPYIANQPAVEWATTLPISEVDKAKLLSGNAKALLRL